MCYLGAYDYIYNRPLYTLILKTLANQARRERVVHWLDSLRKGRARTVTQEIKQEEQ